MKGPDEYSVRIPKDPPLRSYGEVKGFWVEHMEKQGYTLVEEARYDEYQLELKFKREHIKSNEVIPNE